MSSPMLCKKCGSKTGESDSFCMQCGTSLLNQCANCGTELPENAKFCRQCGAPSSLEEPAEEPTDVEQAEQPAPDPEAPHSIRAELTEAGSAKEINETMDQASMYATPNAPTSHAPPAETPDNNRESAWWSAFWDTKPYTVQATPSRWIVSIILWLVLILGGWLLLGNCLGEEQGARSIDTERTTAETVASVPIIFSDGQASAFLLDANDFPKNWTANKGSLKLDAQNDYLTDFNVKMVTITLQTHETEEAAQAAFSTKKTEAQTTIDGRGISGDKLEDVKQYPMFVWNASDQANISGIEKWTVVGVYGNITMEVFHEGSVGAPKKSFAVDIAKDQIDRITGD